MSFMSEFKQFAMRGNVVDLAVGVIVGAAFTNIVNSLVADVIMPPIGILLGGMDFTQFAFTLKPATDTDPAVVIKYGQFIQQVVNFLIIAMSIFILVKFINKLDRKKDTDAPDAPKPTKEEQLLGEIRDLLKTRNGEINTTGSGR